jgi:hypothetical protein
MTDSSSRPFGQRGRMAGIVGVVDVSAPAPCQETGHSLQGRSDGSRSRQRRWVVLLGDAFERDHERNSLTRVEWAARRAAAFDATSLAGSATLLNRTGRTRKGTTFVAAAVATRHWPRRSVFGRSPGADVSVGPAFGLRSVQGRKPQSSRKSERDTLGPCRAHGPGGCRPRGSENERHVNRTWRKASSDLRGHSSRLGGSQANSVPSGRQGMGVVGLPWR